MTVTNFIWDELSDNVLLETDESDALTARYTNRPEQFGKLISQYRIEEEKVVERFYHYDGESSTRNLTDSDENVTDTFIYTAYGEEVARTGTTTNPFGYKGAVGYYTNAETDNIYVRARTYEPAAGRWLSVDPLGFVDGQNLYRAYFVANGDDPSGTITITYGKGALGRLKCPNEPFINWNFRLEKKSPCKGLGYIIQLVEVECAINFPCVCGEWDFWGTVKIPCYVDVPVFPPIPPIPNCQTGPPTKFAYLEAWPVERGKTKSTLNMFDNERYNDKVRFSIGDNSCGSYKQKGEVKFFCEDTTNSKDGRTIQGIGNLKNRGWRSGQSFGPGGCSTTAGDLLSWDVSWNGLETFFNDARYIVEGPSFREFKTNWFC